MSLTKEFYFLCLDNTCSKYKKPEFTSRLNFFTHACTKTNDLMVSVFELYDVIPDLDVQHFHRLSIVNLFVDICKEFNARILLKRIGELQ